LLARLAPVTLLALGCQADTTGLATLTVTDLSALLAGPAGAVLCDANNEQTRSRHGVIPGARLLSSYRDYDPATELPSDKARALVFYCHSAWCGAAADAARKAVAAGHLDVYVLPAGIKGWVAAGRPVARPPAG
jgi:rhodanese-related sulfurtransferase